MLRKFGPSLLLISLSVSAAQGISMPASAQTFDDAGVLALHAAGLGDEAIIAKIRSLPCNYDTSTDRLIALKQAGVGDDIIVAMVERCTGAPRAQGAGNGPADPMAAHAPGIYLEEQGQAGPQLALLRPALAAGIKFTGNGSILFPRLAKLTVPQHGAQLRVAGNRPVFWFYFNAADHKVDSFGTVATIAAQSPNEFSLVRFRQDGGNRQFVVGRVEPYVQVVGVDPKNTIAFSANEVGDSIFKVEMTADLPPGEYGFVLPGEKGAFRIYDFSIPGRPGN